MAEMVTRFQCPNCQAEYRVVRIEAPPTHDHLLLCLSCGGCRPQTTATSLTYHLIRSIFSISDGVLRRPVELAPRKRTSESRIAMSALGHKRTHAPQQTSSLFDHLIGNSEHLGRDVEA